MLTLEDSMINSGVWQKTEQSELSEFVKSAEGNITRGKRIDQAGFVHANVRQPGALQRHQVPRAYNAVCYSADSVEGIRRSFVHGLVTLQVVLVRLRGRVTSASMIKTIQCVPTTEFWNIVWLWKSTLAAHSCGTRQFTTSTVISRTIDWKTYNFAMDGMGKVRFIAVPTAAAQTS
jgi:hypothetical protein